MPSRASLPFATARGGSLCALLFVFTLVTARSQVSAISQTRINEYAANLLRARHKIIDDVVRRRPSERLDIYLSRVVGPFSGERDVQWRDRVEAYVVALERAVDPRALCTSAPATTDHTSNNLRTWKRAVEASSMLTVRVRELRAEWAAQRLRPPNGEATRRLGRSLTRNMLVLKTAFEALREARP